VIWMEMEKEMECKDYDGNIIVRKTVKGVLSIRTQEYEDCVQKKIDDHNANSKHSTVIIFDCYEKAHLWIEECTGQISDGKYENTSNTQWEDVCRMKIAVNKIAKDQVIGYMPRHVNFSFKDLIWLFNRGDRPSTVYEQGVKFEDQKIDTCDVRNVMSNVPTKQLKIWLTAIAKTVNNKVN